MTALPSTLDAVTVYREGAVCRRVAKFPGGPERQLRLGGLPVALDAGSLRARVLSGSTRVVDVRPQYDIELAEEVDVPVEQRALEDAAVKLAQLQVKRQRLNVEISELQQLKPTFVETKRGDPPRPAPVESMLALGEFTEAELTPRLERRRQLDVELEEAQRELQLRQRRVQEASSSKRVERAKLSRVAVVTLAEASAGPLELELEYRVPGARWVPNYALTLERGLTNGALQMRASIAQNSGEDWKDVKLSLSTALPQRRADLPELKALKLGRRQQTPARSGWREPPPGLEALFESYDGAMSRLKPPSAPPTQPSVLMASKLAPPPPPPAPMASGAAPLMEAMAAPARAMRGGAMRAPSAPPPSRSMELPSPKGGAELSRSRAMKKEAAMEMDDEAPADEGGLGGLDEPAPHAPEAPGLAAQLGDYERLVMAAPDAARSSRGKLVAAPEWSSAFAVGVSVQVDVVMGLVMQAQRAAAQVSRLPVPAQCNPVSPVKSFDYRYDCEARLDVPSTGAWVLVPVMACSVGLSPEYVCVPSVEPKVYRTLTIVNRSAHALLPGPVDVTAGEEFLMTTTLPAIAPGADGSHRLGLGVEEAIKVARKTQFKETTGGFLGGSTVLPHDVEIELNNRLATAAVVEVRERVPVPDASEKDLKIEDAAATPPWEKVEEPIDGVIVKGARRWKVTVPAGQSLKLTAMFAIRMPADKMLVGGNRRS